MKHGDKAKGKTAKAGKGTSKKSTPGAAKSSKAPKSSKAARPQVASKQSAGKGRAESGNGASRARVPDGDVRFSNPVVGNAFKRAVKKYPNAFRRLTD